MAAMIASIRQSPWPFPQETETPNGPVSASAAGHEAGAAMRYARALQEGNCDEAIALTFWMRERIERAQLENPKRLADIREELCRSLTDRRIEGNRLAEEGMEDQYLLAPGCELTLVGVDKGRDDLERPAASRAWIRVTYPREEGAPLDLAGLPIRSLVAGINTTTDSYVLKAAVVGNLEIPLDSIDTNWNGHRGNG